jgi:hypothetical protein
LIYKEIIQNKTIGGGSRSLAVLHGKNTIFRAGYIGLNSFSWGRVQREELDIILEDKQLGKNQNN